MKTIKLILFFSLGLNLIAVFFVARRIYWQYYVTSDSTLNQNNSGKPINYWLDRNKLFEVLPKDTNAIVFIGNSLTQNFELVELFKNSKIKNRGINGDLIAGVLNRLAPIISLKPKKIFIEIGINDLGSGIDNNSILSAYKELLIKLRKSLKGTKIYVQSLFPVQNGQSRLTTYCNPTVNRNIKLINKGLKNLTSKYNLTFIDTYSEFVAKGQLNPKYSVDGLHLSAIGYLKWTEILLPYIEEK